MNKPILTLAAIALLGVGGSAMAQTNASGGAKSNAIDPAKTTGAPAATQTPGVEGRSGAESGAQPGKAKEAISPDATAPERTAPAKQ